MNHSLYSADRTTHLKIVVVALVAATVVASVGIAARISGADTGARIEAQLPVVKAGAPIAVSSSGRVVVR